MRSSSWGGSEDASRDPPPPHHKPCEEENAWKDSDRDPCDPGPMSGEGSKVQRTNEIDHANGHRLAARIHIAEHASAVTIKRHLRIISAVLGVWWIQLYDERIRCNQREGQSAQSAVGMASKALAHQRLIRSVHRTGRQCRPRWNRHLLPSLHAAAQ